MSADGGWLLGGVDSSCTSWFVTHARLLHHTGIIHTGLETRFLGFNSKVGWVSYVTMLSCMDLALVSHEGLVLWWSVATPSEMHGTIASQIERITSLGFASGQKSSSALLLIYFIFLSGSSQHIGWTYKVRDVTKVVTSSGTLHVLLTIERVSRTWTVQEERAGSCTPSSWAFGNTRLSGSSWRSTLLIHAAGRLCHGWCLAGKWSSCSTLTELLSCTCFHVCKRVGLERGNFNLLLLRFMIENMGRAVCSQFLLFQLY